LNEAPGTQERYAAATQSSHLRLDSNVIGDADYLIAAGLSKAKFGVLLMRLQSDWDSSTRRIPKKPTRRDIAWAAQKSLGKGITKVTKDSSEAARQKLEAAYRNDVAMLSASLRSLPAVRLHLSTKLLLDGMGDETVTQIILGWLEPTCPFCHGRKMQLQKWSQTELSDQICGGCGGTGERPMVDEVEQAAQAYMSECIGYAQHGIKKRARADH
jgi:hypothetical protein